MSNLIITTEQLTPFIFSHVVHHPAAVKVITPVVHKPVVAVHAVRPVVPLVPVHHAAPAVVVHH